jgi:hypothetical protein
MLFKERGGGVIQVNVKLLFFTMYTSFKFMLVSDIFFKQSWQSA